MQAQIDSMQSSITLLMDKYDSLDYRMNFCEANLTEQLDHNQAKRQLNNSSSLSNAHDKETRSTSQLR